MAKFQKGKPKTGGRQKGTPNKIPRQLRALVQDVLVDAGALLDPKAKDDEDKARAYLLSLAVGSPEDRKLFGALLGKTVERQVNVSADVRETVRLVDLTGLNLADPKVRKRLGPSILGGRIQLEGETSGEG